MLINSVLSRGLAESDIVDIVDEAMLRLVKGGGRHLTYIIELGVVELQ